MSFFARDIHSFDFSLTRIFMNLFRTRSADVVTECQKPFSFLPLRNQVDIRTANFMLRFMATENFICNLFALQAAQILADIYTRYGDSIDSINSLKDGILRQFTGI